MFKIKSLPSIETIVSECLLYKSGTSPRSTKCLRKTRNRPAHVSSHMEERRVGAMEERRVGAKEDRGVGAFIETCELDAEADDEQQP